jgi:altronate dehydratase
LRDDIPFGHKFALHDIAQGDEILKYGMPILRALQTIPAGQWVHTHNGRSDRWGVQNEDLGVLPSVKGNLLRTEQT